MTILDESTTVCPFLGLLYDAQTHFTIPDDRHVCYQANPGQPIQPEYQKRCCLTGDYRNCQGYAAGWKHGLPREVRLKSRQHSSGSSLAVFRVVGLLIIAAAMGLLLLKARAASPEVVQTIPVMPQVSTAVTAPVFSATATATPTLLPSATPTMLPITPTAGPLAETPFGAAGQWLVHRVAQGESLEMIAQRYGTTVEVLRAINIFFAGGLWADTSVVICVGCVDAAGLPVLQPVWVEENITVDDLAIQYGMKPEDLRAFNGIEGDWVLADRWVIVAGK